MPQQRLLKLRRLERGPCNGHAVVSIGGIPGSLTYVRREGGRRRKAASAGRCLTGMAACLFFRGPLSIAIASFVVPSPSPSLHSPLRPSPYPSLAHSLPSTYLHTCRHHRTFDVLTVLARFEETRILKLERDDRHD